jgi:hypothetical protein
MKTRVFLMFLLKLEIKSMNILKNEFTTQPENTGSINLDKLNEASKMLLEKIRLEFQIAYNRAKRAQEISLYRAKRAEESCSDIEWEWKNLWS